MDEMDENERRGYVQMSGPAASFAFVTDGEGTSWVNLWWLADVIRRYEAKGGGLSKSDPDSDLVAAVELEILRPAVQQVDDERAKRFDEEDHQ